MNNKVCHSFNESHFMFNRYRFEVFKAQRSREVHQGVNEMNLPDVDPLELRRQFDHCISHRQCPWVDARSATQRTWFKEARDLIMCLMAHFNKVRSMELRLVNLGEYNARAPARDPNYMKIKVRHQCSF
jgi:hypothetical protein